MTKPKLTQKDFERAAKRLGCEVAAIKAVAHVESRGNGFYEDGFPVILFERHKFRQFTQGRYNKTHPHLSGPAGNYGPAGANQRRKFNEAFELSPIAAMKSCSFGKFQIMGFNHAACGFADVSAFVDAMKESEGRQLDAFVEFVHTNRLDTFLRRLDWASFAEGYNGKGYRKNAYDTKMAAAYKKFNKESSVAEPEPVALLNPTSEPSGSSGQPADTQADPSGISTTQPTSQDINTPASVTATQYQGVGFIGAVKKDFAAVTGGNISFAALQSYATQASGWPEWVISWITKLATLAVVLGASWLIFRGVHYLVWKWGEMKRQSLEANLKADPNKRDVEWV